MHPSICPKCGATVVSAHPPKFSIEDRYGRYRRAMKKSLLSKQEEADSAGS
jgi:H/ACA ribonucleoprotein complex subunit 3